MVKIAWQEVIKNRLMAYKKKTGGRKIGTPNHMPKEIKELIRAALDEAGGQAYLVDQAKNNPSAFMTILGKIIPQDVKAHVQHAFEPLIIKQAE